MTSTATLTLADFLVARIAEDEAVARKVVEYQGNAAGSWTVGSIETFVGATWLAEHIARHDPARVLAECEAKRRIVEAVQYLAELPEGMTMPDLESAMGFERALQAMAAVYADHEDYDESWRL